MINWVRTYIQDNRRGLQNRCVVAENAAPINILIPNIHQTLVLSIESIFPSATPFHVNWGRGTVLEVVRFSRALWLN